MSISRTLYAAASHQRIPIVVANADRGIATGQPFANSNATRNVGDYTTKQFRRQPPPALPRTALTWFDAIPRDPGLPISRKCLRLIALPSNRRPRPALRRTGQSGATGFDWVRLGLTPVADKSGLWLSAFALLTTRTLVVRQHVSTVPEPPDAPCGGTVPATAHRPAPRRPCVNFKGWIYLDLVGFTWIPSDLRRPPVSSCGAPKAAKIYFHRNSPQPGVSHRNLL